jgi:K+-transporting ATPase KdpF subunit
MNANDVIGGLLVVALLLYLIYALLKPEGLQ